MKKGGCGHWTEGVATKPTGRGRAGQHHFELLGGTVSLRVHTHDRDAVSPCSQDEGVHGKHAPRAGRVADVGAADAVGVRARGGEGDLHPP